MHMPWKLKELARRWQADVRGSSMVTTAVTLPLLLIILLGIWYSFWWFTVKQALHHGVADAARQATEYGRYWNIDPTGKSGIESDVLPKDYYDLEARRMVENRLRDISNWSTQTMQNGLVVRVEEPVVAYEEGAAPPIDEGYIKSMCDPEAEEVGDYRIPENIRLRVYAELALPFFQVKIPYMTPITVTLTDRAIGYVQCPRWVGQREGAVNDQSEKLGSEAPYMPYRFPSAPNYPTVTAPAPTAAPGP
jgi:hypothetical protein